MVLRELWMHGDEMEIVGTLAGRRGPHGLRIQYAVTDDAQPPRLLGDQHRLSVRQKGDAPRMNEARRDRHHADPLISADIKNTRDGWSLRNCRLLRVAGHYQREHQQCACPCDKRIRPHWNLHWMARG